MPSATIFLGCKVKLISLVKHEKFNGMEGLSAHACDMLVVLLFVFVMHTCVCDAHIVSIMPHIARIHSLKGTKCRPEVDREAHP